MGTLVFGLLIFFGIHMVPAFPDSRAGLVSSMGESGYKMFFSLLSVVGLVIAIWGYSGAGFYDMYVPPSWGAKLNIIFMVLALIALSSSHLQGRMRLALKDPMSVGVALWAVGHLFANGDWASVLLFGSFLLYSLLDIFTENERVPYQDFEAKSSHDILAVVIGVVLYIVIVLLHPYLFGASAIPVI